MGVYSELAAQKVNEATMLENFQFTDLLEYAINIDRGNQAMFDAMLEMDFHEAYAEKGLISINEANEKTGIKAVVDKIVAKIKELWEKFLSVATTFMAKLRNVLSQFSGRNKALLKEGKDKNLTGNIDKVKEAIPEGYEVTVCDLDQDAFSKTFTVDVSKLTDIIDADTVDVESVKKDIEDVFPAMNKDINEYFKKVNLKDNLGSGKGNKIDLSQIQLDLSYNSAGNSQVDNAVAPLVTAAKNAIKNTKAEKIVKGESDNDARLKANNKLVAYSAIVKAGIKYMNFYKSVIARKLMYERSVYAKCLSLLKRADKKSVEESTDLTFTLGAIDLVNESVIEELFV